MSDFADVEEFGRQHTACGGITPSAAPQPAGGFLLTLTCACGATFDRWVTVEDAKKPLPLPPRGTTAPARRPPTPRPPPAPSADLDAVLRAALDAEAAAGAPAAASPKPPPAAKSQDLDAIMRDALIETQAAAQKPAAPRPPAAPPAPRERTSPAKLNLDSTIRTALTQQSELAAAGTARPAPRTRRTWLVLLAVAALGVSAAIYFGLGTEAPSGPPAAEAPLARPLDQQQRAALEETLKSLRQLQAASSAGTTLSVYSSRVIFAKSDVERLMGGAPPGPARDRVREVLDLHMLAAAAWRARSIDQKDAWEAVGQDPAVDLCPSVKRVVDFAAQPENVSRAQSRGAAVASTIPLLWECAGEKLAALDQAAAAR
jgi:hypothetical protein